MIIKFLQYFQCCLQLMGLGPAPVPPPVGNEPPAFPPQVEDERRSRDRSDSRRRSRSR